MDRLGSPPRTKNGNTFLVLATDLCSKPRRMILTLKATAMQTATLSLNYWIVHYGLPEFPFTDTVPQFVIRFLATPCGLLELKDMPVTSYSSQTSRHVKGYNKTTLPALRHYSAENRENWDMFFQRRRVRLILVCIDTSRCSRFTLC